MTSQQQPQHKPYKCDKCFDTGCCCGGIGLSCHGCCDCEAGEQARRDRVQALEEVSMIIRAFNKKKD